MQATPIISCVTGVYNAGPYICETIESILDQTFRDFEYILINDGSTDDSLAKIEKYAPCGSGFLTMYFLISSSNVKRSTDAGTDSGCHR